jgi:MFS family permease
MFRARLGVSLIFFINGFFFANWISRIPRLQDHYNIDNGTLGIILLMHAIGALIAMPTAGYLIVKNGSRKVTRLAALLFVLLTPFIPMMPNVIFLGAWYMLLGAIVGVMDVAMNAQAVLVEQGMKKPIMSSFHAVFSGGMMLGAGAGALFTYWEIDLFAHLVVVCTFCLFLCIWSVLQLISDDVEASETVNEPGFRLPDRSLLGIGLIAFCCMLGEGAMADWSTSYMENIALANEVIAPFGLAAFSTAMMIGRIFGDWARQRFGDPKLLLLSSLIALAGITIVITWIAVPVVISGLFLVGLGLATMVPIAYSIAGNSPGLAPGLGISMVTTIGYSGFLFGPPIIGFIADWQTLRIAFVFVFGLFVLMTLMSIRNRRKQAVVKRKLALKNE